MPLARSPKLLRTLCINCVVKNIEFFYKYCSFEKEPFLEPSIYLNELPVCCLDAIINILKEGNKLTGNYAHRLFCSRLVELNFTKSDYSIVDNFLRLIWIAVSKCKKLNSLIMAGLKIHEPIRLRFILHFKHLHYINVQNSKIGDEFLKLVGSTCVKLRKLNICACPVSNTGVRWLCESGTAIRVINSSLNEEIHFGRCKLIESISIRYTNINKRGVKILLRNLENLKVLDFDFSITVLASIHRNFVLRGLPVPPLVEPSFTLLNLNYRYNFGRSFPTGSIALAIQMCNYSTVREVHLDVQNWMDVDDIFALRVLQNLEKLIISNYERGGLSFVVAIAPLLPHIGKSLMYFAVTHFVQVNVGAIIRNCPNLLELTLLNNVSYVPNMSSLLPEGLPSLQDLSIVGSDPDRLQSSVPTKELASLIFSRNLKHIQITENVTLTDNILINAFRFHQFENLESLELSECHKITKDGFEVFMNDCNRLVNIDISACKLLSNNENHNRWVALIRENNWRVHYSFLIGFPYWFASDDEPNDPL